MRGLADGLEHRHRGLVVVAATADDDPQTAGLRLGLGAEDRGVQETKAALLGCRMLTRAHRRRDGGQVDDDRRGVGIDHYAVGTQRHVLHRCVVRQAVHDELRVLHRLGQTGHDSSPLTSESVSPLWRPVEDGDLMTGGQQVAGHPATHRAETNESDLCHFFRSSACSVQSICPPRRVLGVDGACLTRPRRSPTHRRQRSHRR